MHRQVQFMSRMAHFTNSQVSIHAEGNSLRSQTAYARVILETKFFIGFPLRGSCHEVTDEVLI